ncbi:MAG: L,D-transpeptidase [Thermomicrobiales bacterium]|nr:L,D-transpeptidase [Thermomicrobiales bacterium]
MTFALLAAAAMCLTLSVGHTAAQEWAPPRTVFVPETGHTTDGLFLSLWRSERALLGDPVTEEFKPRSGFTNLHGADVIQYYEHLALVYLPDEAPEQQVQTLDLGRQALTSARDTGASNALSRALERTVCPPASSGCLNVVSSGHTVREPFLSYWTAGDAAALLGTPLTEAFRAPDGTRVQYFENGILRQTGPEEVDPLPLGDIAAEKAGMPTAPIEQPKDVPTYSEELWVPPASPTPDDSGTATADSWSAGPGPQQGGWREVVVSISQQRMWAYENGELVVTSLVSTGTADVPETVTPVGYHTIVAKYDVQTMEGTISDEYYRVEDVPNVMYFDNLGNALHGAYWHNNFGAPMSHGCINLPLDIAAWMYGWAEVGTPVTVIG